MRSLFIPVVVIGLFGCSKQQPTIAEHSGTVVFFNFYDERVRAELGQKQLFQERLTVEVEDESTGLSKTIPLAFQGCAKLRVTSKNGHAERELCPKSNGFGVWVSPESKDGPPQIVFEEVFTPALD